jgi:hypothetical protein
MTNHTVPFEADESIWSGHRPVGFTRLTKQQAIDYVAQTVRHLLDDPEATASVEHTARGHVLSVETMQSRDIVDQVVARAFQELGMLKRS